MGIFPGRGGTQYLTPLVGRARARETAVDAAKAGGPVPDLAEEARAHAEVRPAPDAVVERVGRALDAGARTLAGEPTLEELLDGLPYRGR
ncbi:hypothetical protein ACFXAZ_15520 [Streptomyces sp. NPDC059477]|uniref:hypothetical protein n=1 Tax=Streptomyces sp. NPDC059477 TaxID=3346847 RepID=UPI0036CA44C2